MVQRDEMLEAMAALWLLGHKDQNFSQKPTSLCPLLCQSPSCVRPPCRWLTTGPVVCPPTAATGVFSDAPRRCPPKHKVLVGASRKPPPGPRKKERKENTQSTDPLHLQTMPSYVIGYIFIIFFFFFQQTPLRGWPVPLPGRTPASRPP